jgi:hypothetical protein
LYQVDFGLAFIHVWSTNGNPVFRSWRGLSWSWPKDSDADGISRAYTLHQTEHTCSLDLDSVQRVMRKRRARLAGRSDDVLVWNPCHERTLPQHMSCSTLEAGINPSVGQEACPARHVMFWMGCICGTKVTTACDSGSCHSPQAAIRLSSHRKTDDRSYRSSPTTRSRKHVGTSIIQNTTFTSPAPRPRYPTTHRRPSP